MRPRSPASLVPRGGDVAARLAVIGCLPIFTSMDGLPALPYQAFLWLVPDEWGLGISRLGTMQGRFAFC